MKFIDKLERKFGNRGIENLTIYIIVSYVLGYALMYINPGALSMLSLNVSEILHGQIMETCYMDYLSAEYVICFMVYDCDIVLLLSDQCIAGTYMGIIQIYCIYFIWNDFYSNFCVYFVILSQVEC